MNLAELVANTDNDAAAAAETVDDAAIVGGLLMTAEKGVPLGVLADVNGWTLNRTSAAVTQLDAQLKTVGMTLLRFGDDEVKLVASVSAATSARVQVLLRRTYSRTGLNIRQAKVLYRVYCDRVTGAEQSNNDRVALAELVNAGLVVHDDARRANRPRLSEDVILPGPRRPE